MSEENSQSELFYFDVIASCFGLFSLCIALWQFASVEIKLYLCKKRLLHHFSVYK